MTTASALRAEFPIASRWRRLFAYLVDVAVLLIPSLIVVFITVAFTIDDIENLFVEQSDGTFEFREGGEEEFNDALSRGGLVALVLSGIYYIVFTATTGQTAGKALLRIRVVEVALGLGANPSWSASALRFLIYALPGAVGVALSLNASTENVAPLFSIAGTVVILWILWDKAARGLHDIVAGTLVVRKIPPESWQPVSQAPPW